MRRYSLLDIPFFKGMVVGALIGLIIAGVLLWSGSYVKTIDDTVTYVRIWEGPNGLDLFYVTTLAVVLVIAFAFLGGVIYTATP